MNKIRLLLLCFVSLRSCVPTVAQTTDKSQPVSLLDKDTHKDLPNVALLKKTVSITAYQSTLPRMLSRLQEIYGVPVLCDSEARMPERANVRLSAMPLHKALDQLTQTIYKGAEWEYRKAGFIVVRGKNNSATEEGQKAIYERIRKKSGEQIEPL